MKKIFYTGIIGLTIFEILNVYFIMPMPGSQHANTIDIAYFLYRYRWILRGLFLLMIAIGLKDALTIKHKWIPIIACLPAIAVAYIFNFKMTADHMFLQPEYVTFKNKEENKFNDSTLVVAVEYHGQAKAYPIRYLVYHHQVRDTLGGKSIMVTYCSVCRTGRVFEPTVNGKDENFRLVGMDHFNAMFEDASTKSWWRQATGEAITGSLKGTTLPEIECTQLSIGTFFNLYPSGKVMQADISSKENYDSLGKYEKGKSKGSLTRTDTAEWNDKSWVVGIQIGHDSKAYAWKQLKERHFILDKVGDKNIALFLGTDSQSFAAFERNEGEVFIIRHDTIISGDKKYNFSGKELEAPFTSLKKLNGYQEFWHSWRTFHPGTGQFH